MSIVVPPPVDPKSSAQPAFEVLSTRRVDPTEQLTLLRISGAFETAEDVADPVLFCSSPNGMDFVTALWVSREGRSWSAEFAFDRSRLSAADTRVKLMLAHSGLIDVPIPEPSPTRRESHGVIVAVVACALTLAMSVGWQALQGNDEPALSSRSPVPSLRPAGRDAPVRQALTPSAVLAASPDGKTLVAHAVTRRVGLYRSSTVAKPWTFLRNPTTTGAPAVFTVKRAAGDRFKVRLPIRPNSSTAWIKAKDVRLTRTDYRARVDLRSHRLTVWRGDRKIIRTPIGTGRSATPTPTGVYYVTALLKQSNPKGLYGPYAFALSGHSKVFTEFDGGNGRIGIHGTNQPSGIGKNVSHGCIRVANDVIRRLARLLPLGTPVRIMRS